MPLEATAVLREPQLLLPPKKRIRRSAVVASHRNVVTTPAWTV